MTASQNESIRITIQKEKKRLFDFIRKRVPEKEDAEDIMQDVFFQYTQTFRDLKTIDKVSSWLFTVARNKITDLYRKKKPQSFSKAFPEKTEDGQDIPFLGITDLLMDNSGNPESEYLKQMLWATLEEALEELPSEQRDVFVFHELEGRSFKEISDQTGEGVNTLLSRKRYAVLFLRERLQSLYNDFMTY